MLMTYCVLALFVLFCAGVVTDSPTAVFLFIHFYFSDYHLLMLIFLICDLCKSQVATFYLMDPGYFLEHIWETELNTFSKDLYNYCLQLSS